MDSKEEKDIKRLEEQIRATQSLIDNASSATKTTGITKEWEQKIQGLESEIASRK